MALFHFHKWRATAVDSGRAQRFDNLTFHHYDAGLATWILYVCECGENRIKVLDGEWTLEAVRGDAVPPAASSSDTKSDVVAARNNENEKGN